MHLATFAANERITAATRAPFNGIVTPAFVDLPFEDIDVLPADESVDSCITADDEATEFGASNRGCPFGDAPSQGGLFSAGATGDTVFFRTPTEHFLFQEILLVGAQLSLVWGLRRLVDLLTVAVVANLLAQLRVAERTRRPPIPGSKVLAKSGGSLSLHPRNAPVDKPLGPRHPRLLKSEAPNSRTRKTQAASSRRKV
jgi:hypothetical protein